MLFSGFPSKLQEQRLDKARCWFPGFGSFFLESNSVFVLDVQVKQMDFSEETLFWICFFYKYDI